MQRVARAHRAVSAVVAAWTWAGWAVAGSFVLGAFLPAAAAADPGLVDEVRLYSRALTAEEIWASRDAIAARAEAAR